MTKKQLIDSGLCGLPQVSENRKCRYCSGKW